MGGRNVNPSNPTPRWKIWAAAAALFFSGLAVGLVVTVAIAGRIVRKTIEAASSGQGAFIDRGAERLHSTLVAELKLDPAQSSAVRQSLDVTTTKLKAVRSQTRDELRQIARAGFLDISRQLSPEQREKFRQKAQSRMERIGLGTEKDPLPIEPSAP